MLGVMTLPLVLMQSTQALQPSAAQPILVASTWSAEGNQYYAAFASSVRTAGDINGDGFSDVIVSAFRYDNGESDEGRVYVYKGSSAGLETIPAWTAEGNQSGAFFGGSAGPPVM